MGFKNRLIHYMTSFAYSRFEKNCFNPQKIQQELWKRNLSLYRSGTYWHSFPELSKGKLENFPLSEYEDYRDAISLSKQSGINPLTGETVLFYADSAGTTAYPKEFPITETYRKDYQSTQALLIHKLTEAFPTFLDTPALYIVATDSAKKTNSGIEIGYISNYNYKHMPSWLARFYAIPREVLREESLFQEWAPAYALTQELSAIFVITPLVLCNFFRRIIDSKESLIEKLRNPRKVPTGFPPLSCASPRRDHLIHILQMKEPSIEMIWPRLSLICTWKASLAGLQIPELRKWLPKVPIVDGMYSATEAWFNVPLADTENLGGPLCHEAGIFEFLPLDKERTPTHLLRSWELKQGEDYEVFITTSMGMIRYRLKDVVHCRGHLGQSPLIYFKYKAENLISLTTLRISEGQIAQALSQVGIFDLSYLRAAPSEEGTHLILAHNEKSKNYPSQIEFEKALQNVNPYYREERECEHVRSCQIKLLPSEHPIFARHVQHAQSKPRLVSQTPV